MGGVGYVEADARHEQAIKKSLEHRRQAERPSWKLRDKRLRGAQPRHIGLDTLLIARCVVIVLARVGPQNRVEALRVEIEQVNLVPGRLQARQRLVANGRVKTVHQRMAIQIQYPHARGAKVRILPGFSKPNGSTSCLKPS